VNIGNLLRAASGREQDDHNDRYADGTMSTQMYIQT
jgi:hypothetical protein